MSEMECGCVCDVGDGEPIECWTGREIVARKEHQCDECSEPISKGETHFFGKGVCDGSWMCYRCCIPCRRIAESFCCTVLGSLRDDLLYVLGFDYVTGEEERCM